MEARCGWAGAALCDDAGPDVVVAPIGDLEWDVLACVLTLLDVVARVILGIASRSQNQRY